MSRTYHRCSFGQPHRIFIPEESGEWPQARLTESSHEIPNLLQHLNIHPRNRQENGTQARLTESSHEISNLAQHQAKVHPSVFPGRRLRRQSQGTPSIHSGRRLQRSVDQSLQSSPMALLSYLSRP